jgi:uncharacterized C2H2 Zn-finger protein
LIFSRHVEPVIEERRLAILCLRYLTFDHLDPDISEPDLEGYLMDGSFAFQDYAVLHWVGHLDTIIKSAASCKIDQPQDLASAVDGFHDTYGSGDVSREDHSDEFVEQMQKLQDAGLSENSLLLLTHARDTRAGDEKLTGLGDLSRVLKRARSMLEILSQSPSLTTATKEKLRRYYGENWFKCGYHKCFYFHEGFKDVAHLQNHLSRHERPYCCTELSCPRTGLGFPTEKELKKHVTTQHPDPAVFAWRFPKIKKEATKHTCSICSKEYTRSHSVLVHMRTHINERPWKCDFCDSAFVRKSDLQRHRKLHVLNEVPKDGSSKLDYNSRVAGTEASDAPNTQDDMNCGGKSAENTVAAEDGFGSSQEEIDLSKAP